MMAEVREDLVLTIYMVFDSVVPLYESVKRDPRNLTFLTQSQIY